MEPTSIFVVKENDESVNYSTGTIQPNEVKAIMCHACEYYYIDTINVMTVLLIRSFTLLLNQNVLWLIIIELICLDQWRNLPRYQTSSFIGRDFRRIRNTRRPSSRKWWVANVTPTGTAMVLCTPVYFSSVYTTLIIFINVYTPVYFSSVYTT